MKNSYRIAEISFGYSHWDAFTEFDYMDIHFEVHRYGANFSVEAVKDLISRLRGDVDAFALSSLPPTVCLGNQSFVHRQYFEIMNTPSSVPLCDGTGLRELLNMQSLIELVNSKKIEVDDGIFFPSTFLNTEIEEFLRHQKGARVAFGDLFSILGLPLVLRPFPGLMTAAQLSLNLATLKGIKSRSSSIEGPLQKAAKDLLPPQLENYRYVAADLPLIAYFGKDLDIYKDKELIIWSRHAGVEKHIQDLGVSKIHNLLPEQYQLSPYMDYPILEAVLRLTHQRTASLSFEEWQDLLDVPLEALHTVKKHGLTRKVSSQVKVSRTINRLRHRVIKEQQPDFAFVVHALSHRDFERLPVIGNAIKAMPKSWHDPFDKSVARLPAITYGEVNNVVSESSGRAVNGIIYALLATPKVLKSTPPEIIYEQIQKCCHDAAERGAKIIGLGAYTKVVGDSGVTISKNSPIPVTTGNSLSASATLWGLHEVVKKMRLVKFDPENGRVQGTAMVIGATGSIGKVSAKLLSLVFNRLILVAPRLDRLNELATELKQLNPRCEIIVSTDANEWAPVADALVTATSAFDQKIIDVMKLKPGCVVCDCSRPLDFTKEDAKKRPDVIIMESGELVLPGSYEMTCDLGLPGKTVYACLAETTVLALEGRYESFTLGRDIDWVKVKEIYQLSLKHGVKLASIQGHMGILSDREIALTRELALSRLK